MSGRMQGPWAADITDDGAWALYSGSKVIAQRAPWPSRAEESKANAAFIVRAVNSHDALVAALTRLLAAADNSTCDSLACDAARAALRATTAG